MAKSEFLKVTYMFLIQHKDISKGFYNTEIIDLSDCLPKLKPDILNNKIIGAYIFKDSIKTWMQYD